MPIKNTRVAEMLNQAADLFEQRDKEYGSCYKIFGSWVSNLFPEGITLKTESDYTRFGLLVQIFSKLQRYCNNFNNAGHPDSLKDLSVYATMLLEIDEEEHRDASSPY
jgi:hypothetical protein